MASTVVGSPAWNIRRVYAQSLRAGYGCSESWLRLRSSLGCAPREVNPMIVLLLLEDSLVGPHCTPRRSR